MSEIACPICRATDADERPSAFDGMEVSCPRCGHFKITRSAIAQYIWDEDESAILSGWIREQFDAGDTPLVTTQNLPLIVNIKPPPMSERVNRFLLRIGTQLNFWPGSANHDDPALISTIYGRTTGDVWEIMQLLERKGFISNVTTGDFRVTTEGMIHAEELLAKNPASRQGFVAMSFAEEMKAIYEAALEPAIREAGYQPIRVDAVEHANDINDEMIAQIKRSRFIVADMTGHRNGVYFEAGYGMGMGLQVILTCRKDHLDNLHFDLRQFNCVDWIDANDLRQRLLRRIQHVIGQGPIK